MLRRAPAPPARRAGAMPPVDSVFRPFRPSDAERSDRAAGDRARHREKVRQAIRENIADIIAVEAIIGKSRDRIIKVPIRGIKEYRFIYGNAAPGVGQGNGQSQPGQVVGRHDAEGKPERAGDRPGIDYYETDVRLDELIDLMFEDLELPDLERKRLREIPSERTAKRMGYRQVGIRQRLDKRRTVRARVKRMMATRGREKEEIADVEAEDVSERRFPFHDDDLTYRHLITDVREESNAVVVCIMDTSGSM